MARDRLYAGMKVILPSGNVIELIRPLGVDWLCVYRRGSAKGEVEFSVVQLRRWLRGV